MGKEIFYHGTNRNLARSIIESGEILSPWYREVRFLENLDPENYASMVGKNVGISIEDLALKFVSSGYSEAEMEHRVKCVSFAKDIALARSYATRGGNVGMIFGIDADTVEYNAPSWVAFVPKRVDLKKSLCEIYVPKDMGWEEKANITRKYLVPVKTMKSK